MDINFIDPEVVIEMLFQQGNDDIRKGNFEQALENYNQIFLINPNRVAVCTNRGKVKHILNDFTGALEDLSRAINLDPNYSLAYEGRADVRMDISDFTVPLKIIMRLFG